jgi:hypothetical protein
MGGGLRPGFRNYCSNGPAIYCSPDFNYALSYTNENNLGDFSVQGVDFRKIRMVFQCRVNPKTLNEHNS